MAPQPSMNERFKFVDSQLEKVREENKDLRSEVGELKNQIEAMKTEMMGLQFLVSENVSRREAVEKDLVNVHAKQTVLDGELTNLHATNNGLVETQKEMRSALEVHAQYSRRTQLLFSGKAIPPELPGENTLLGILSTIQEYLGITIMPSAIAACHRLQNKNVILVRFLSYGERDMVYRQRISPRKPGLSIHESLTVERLEVVKTLQKIHLPKEKSPLHTYYTSEGKIYIKPRGCKRQPGLIVPVGSSKEDILKLCQDHLQTHGPDLPEPDSTHQQKRKQRFIHQQQHRQNTINQQQHQQNTSRQQQHKQNTIHQSQLKQNTDHPQQCMQEQLAHKAPGISSKDVSPSQPSTTHVDKNRAEQPGKLSISDAPGSSVIVENRSASPPSPQPTPSAAVAPKALDDHGGSDSDDMTQSSQRPKRLSKPIEKLCL